MFAVTFIAAANYAHNAMGTITCITVVLIINVHFLLPVYTSEPLQTPLFELHSTTATLNSPIQSSGHFNKYSWI